MDLLSQKSVGKDVLVDIVARLQILHDCILREIRWSSSAAGDRSLILTVQCPTDLGDPAWDGKWLRISATDVRIFTSKLFGYATGPEVITSWDKGMLPSTEKIIKQSEPAGLSFPNIRQVIACASGSEIEIICSRIDVEVIK